MEKRLEKLIDRLLNVANIRNLNENNPIKISLENPNANDNTIIICSVVEPHNYPLPLNVTWINADPFSQNYKKALKRAAKIAQSGSAYKHHWIILEKYIDVFVPPQYYEPVDSPDAIANAQEIITHMYDNNNPHHTDYNQVRALGIAGGTMQGPLYLADDPLETMEAATKRYIDQLATTLNSVINTEISARVNVENNLATLQNDYNLLYTDFTNYKTKVEQLKGFRFIQTTPSVIWNIPHNLSTIYLNCQTYDSNGEMIWPNKITITDNSNVQVVFSFPMAGWAALCLV